MKANELNPLSVNDFLTLFDRFTVSEQRKIAGILQRRTLAERWEQLRSSLPDTAIGEDEVMAEVKAFRNKRYGKA